MLQSMIKLFSIFIIIQSAANAEEANNIKQIIQTYEQNLESSIKLDKEDKILINSWASEFQLKRINLTTKFRVQMTRHKEHSFNKNQSNDQWLSCLHIHKRQIRRSEKEYYENENECLTTTTIDDGDMIEKVTQVAKEIKRWRKGYRYLVKTCRDNHPTDIDEYEICLIQYMEKDNYNKVIQRLIMLKLEAMGNLYLHFTTSVSNLKECLKTQLSSYLERLRSLMEALNKCYELKTKSEES